MMSDAARRLAALVSEPSRDDAHDPNRLARVERTRVEMMAQGQAIEATLAAAGDEADRIASALRVRGVERIAIVGCGDSWFAGMAVRHAVEVLTGMPVEAAQALDYACYGARTASRTTAVIGLSAGGNTPAVMEALHAARRRGAYAVGVSNTPGTPIQESFDAALLVHATRKGWPTQSTTAAMGLLVRLGTAIARAGRSAPSEETEEIEAFLRSLPNAVDDLARSLDAEMMEIGSRLAASRLVLFTGLGPNFASAAIGAAKIKELSPVHALAVPLEEMHHYRAQKRGDPVVMVATDPASRERALDTALVSEAMGSRLVALVSAEDPEISGRAERCLVLPAVAPALAPFLAVIPLHLLAYHFAKARDGLGLGYHDATEA